MDNVTYSYPFGHLRRHSPRYCDLSNEEESNEIMGSSFKPGILMFVKDSSVVNQIRYFVLIPVMVRMQAR
jgi:hypothetical protein